MEFSEILNMVGLEVAVGCRVTHLHIFKGVQDRVKTSPHMSRHSYATLLFVFSEKGKRERVSVCSYFSVLTAAL